MCCLPGKQPRSLFLAAAAALGKQNEQRSVLFPFHQKKEKAECSHPELQIHGGRAYW